MKKRIFNVALAVSVLAACDVMETHNESCGEEMIELGVSLPAEMTKVTGESGEDAVADLQVFVFDGSGNLEAYGHAAASSLTLSCYPGSKKAVALVNAPGYRDITSYSGLVAKLSLLTDNAVGRLVMEGETDVRLTTSSSVTVPVTRIAAKITLKSVVNAMELEFHRQQTFALTSVYLINVAGDRKYLSDSAPEKWYNKMKYESGSPSFLWQSLNGKVLDYDAAHSDGNYFYCYPNHTEEDFNEGSWKPRHTRLVVEATLGGTTCYYPVTLPEVDQNTAYEISLTVTRPGSDSPDDPVDTHSAEFKINVVDWIDGGDINETI